MRFGRSGPAFPALLLVVAACRTAAPDHEDPARGDAPAEAADAVADPATALIELARTLEADGDHEGALDVYRRVLAVRPDDTRARLGAGNCLVLAGNTVQARREYLAAYRAGSRDPELLNNLASVSLHLGRDVVRAAEWAAAAVAAYRAGLEHEQSELRRAVTARRLAHALGTLGEVHLGEGELTEARANFEESLWLLGDKRPALRRRRLNQIAYCCEKLGEMERAEELRAQAARTEQPG